MSSPAADAAPQPPRPAPPAGCDSWLDWVVGCLHYASCDHGAQGHHARAELAELRKAKDAAYRERDMLVAALSKVFPSYLGRHPEDDTSWDADWRWIVYVELPTGQASWHIHDSERPWFSHLAVREDAAWDGHTTEEKYRRLDALRAELAELRKAIADAEHERDEAWKLAEQRRQDRADVLNIEVKEGMLASEWVMRTATAERERDEARKAHAEAQGKLAIATANAAELAQQRDEALAQVRYAADFHAEVCEPTAKERDSLRAQVAELRRAVLGLGILDFARAGECEVPVSWWNVFIRGLRESLAQQEDKK